MEFLVFAIIGYFIFRIFKSSKDQKEHNTIIDSVPNFQIKVNKELKQIGNSETDCLVIQQKGWVRSLLGSSVSGNYIITIADITDENTSPIPILSKYQEYAEDDGHIFGLKIPSDFFIDGYFKEWSMLVPVPLNLLSFPKKGRRKIEIRVAFGSNSLNVRLGVPQNKEFLFGSHMTSIDLNVDDVGYLELEENQKEFEELAIMLALLTACVDDSLDQSELDVIKRWSSNLAQRYQDENLIESKKKELQLFIRENAKLAEDKKLTMTNIISQIKEKLSKNQKYDALELMLDVMAADSVLEESENKLIEQTVKSLDLDYDKFKELRDIRLAKIKTSNIKASTSESLFGLNENMTKQEKCTELTKQYSEWSGRSNSKDPNTRERAKQMIDLIVKLRQKNEC
jgi:tellurite resistance protein